MKLQLQPSKNGQTSTPDPKPDLQNPKNDKTLDTHEPHLFTEDFDSACSTPYVSAPSSPGRGPGTGRVNGGFFYSCPASPMHFAITSTAVSSFTSSSAMSSPDNNNSSVPLGYEFEFSARFGSSGSGQPGSMSSADELFLNGQIRPMKLSTHLERPQVLAPLLDLENEEQEEEGDVNNEVNNDARMVSTRGRGRDLTLRDKSLRRRTRSMSPLRSSSFEFVGDDDYNDDDCKNVSNNGSCGSSSLVVYDESIKLEEEAATPSVSASSSRSSSAGRNSKRWVFLKDFLYRSKSEGRSNNKFWSNISFSPAKEKKSMNNSSLQVSASKEKVNNNNNNNNNNVSSLAMEGRKVKGGSGSSRSGQGSSKKPVNGVGKRRVPASPHELHYKASRAQAEEMRKKTFLPYKPGLLGCLGFSSKGYGAMNGIARALNPVSSR